MSEQITEMVLPGTYIDVRPEGLIGVGGIATGNVGVVGTASAGPIHQVEILSSPGDIEDLFGPMPPWDGADGATNLSLVRTLRHVFAGGASTVFAVRIAVTDGDGVPADNQAEVTTAEVAEGLQVLADEPVQILAIGGFVGADVAGQVSAHLDATETDGRERIAVLGVENALAIAPDAVVPAGPRVVQVTPGLTVQEGDTEVTLPESYAAAVVAGRLASLPPHGSPTNKDLAISGLSTRYNRGQQKTLLGKRLLVLHQSFGFRILQGISTDGGPFRQISVRRIVDYAKAGVRKGANPYIGRLNNPRVRAALQATLDGFLSGMVVDEMLQGYELTVEATRAEEIQGIARVELLLQPTFSIDFIKVIMNLA
ncbi:MAG: phage tail sheath C-terminal domain-containing protein [Acidobacteriota bacterium]